MLVLPSPCDVVICCALDVRSLRDEPSVLCDTGLLLLDVGGWLDKFGTVDNVGGL